MHQPCEYHTPDYLITLCNGTCVRALGKVLEIVNGYMPYSVAASRLGSIGEKINTSVLEMKRLA